MGKERRHCFTAKGTNMPKEKDCLNNAVKNCCACREGEDNSVRSNTDIGLRGNIGIKIFGIILSALIVFFNYSPRMRAVRALPKAVFINSVSTLNAAEKGEAQCLDYFSACACGSQWASGDFSQSCRSRT